MPRFVFPWCHRVGVGLRWRCVAAELLHPLCLLLCDVWSRQGLLFKVNGVSSTAPVYGALSSIMLALCSVFLFWWLLVAAASVARQLHVNDGNGGTGAIGWLPGMRRCLQLRGGGSGNRKHGAFGTTSAMTNVKAAVDVPAEKGAHDSSGPSLTVVNPLHGHGSAGRACGSDGNDGGLGPGVPLATGDTGQRGVSGMPSFSTDRSRRVWAAQRSNGVSSGSSQ